ncbi:trypsin-like peptidase domain-containing protein [Actinoplanes sp. NPDC026619]|uniref:S1C family serine protease n=1 Tax=Actinoplanes sp. NPDC026619 TaxID=3155798 RepID=UPI0033F7CD5C
MHSEGAGPVMTVLADGPPPPPEPAQPRRRWNPPPGSGRKVLIGVLAVWAVAITGLVLFRGGDSAPAPVATAQPKPSASDAPLTVSDVYKTVLPSVVRITSTGKSGTAAGAKSMAESSTGTGVIANANGTILTAAHVIDGAVAIKITYADGTTSAAEVATKNDAQDIATLTPAQLPETLVPATLGGGLQVGDDVVAIGNPLGLTASTSSGVVSGLDRTMSRDEGGNITGLIQFDAAVNPGSSGGPLINDRGQVSGIVVALANPTEAGTFIGIGFAVPIGAALGATGQGDGRTPPL